jgi:valyl-tRNA synthetase
MSLPKIYDPSAVEQKWYAHWLKNQFFHSEPDTRNPHDPDYQEPFTIVMPPPNVTGILHMGHMLNNTIQDMLIRRARMIGKNACWVPGTDHASIATEAKVVALLKERGQTKREIGREKFLELAYEWKEKYGGIILDQLKKLGASCDWDRTRFTMEPKLSEAVIDTFIRLYKEGYIYRGARMVNWDPVGRTTVSDEEVNVKPVQAQLHFLKYPLVGTDQFMVVATTRPETIMADVAICVHPDDPRYQPLHGKRVRIPLFDREIPIITDPLVSMDFGTGGLKITPAHALMDYEIGLKYGLPIIDALNEDGTLNQEGGVYAGLDRFIARKKIVEDLLAGGFLEKSENSTSQIGFSERTDSIIEPRISTQWFMRMEQYSKPALQAVYNPGGETLIDLIPEKFLNTYRYWMENIRDWCISRQLWWGQQIPAWYNENQEWVVAKTREEAIAQFKEKGMSHQTIRQDEDVLDTWFSSWLWPVSVFDGIIDPENPDYKYYYPTHDLVTGQDILFLWVARMIMIGMDFSGKIPFQKVYLTGMVRDKLGRKMSKSLGNSPDPIGLIDQYGADAIRMGLLLSSPAGNDLLYDESLVHQGRNFANKIWNAYRLLESWSEKIQDSPQPIPDHEAMALAWFKAQIQEISEQLPGLYTHYKLSEILMALYRLTWDDFCGWFLEMIKPSEGKTLHKETFRASLGFFRILLMQLHPIMPFITEELWEAVNSLDPVNSSLNSNHFRGSNGENDLKARSIMFAQIGNLYPWLESLPKMGEEEKISIMVDKVFKPSISEIRNIRNTYKIPMREALVLGHSHQEGLDGYSGLYQKLAGIREIKFLKNKPENTVNFSFGAIEFYLFVEEKLNKEVEIARIQEEIKYTRGFLQSVMVKLDNEKFMAHAKPQVKELENKKKEDALEKLRQLEESLQSLI